MKYRLYIINKDNTEDKFEFNSYRNLFEFLNDLMYEKLVDNNFLEMEYYIIVGEN